MNSRVQKIVEQMSNERARQYTLPGSEWDGKHTPNDWVAIINSYISEEVKRNGQLPSAADFENSLTKAGAIIIAALEHVETMQEKSLLK